MMPTFRPHSSANIERMEFTKKLVALMRDKNLNQTDLAKKAGLTRDAVSTYCRARSMPEPSNLAKLAKALGVEPAYFQLDYYRIAEKMASPTPFDAQAEVGQHLDATPVNTNRCELTMQPDGRMRVEIVAFVAMEEATKLAQIYRDATKI